MVMPLLRVDQRLASRGVALCRRRAGSTALASAAIDGRLHGDLARFDADAPNFPALLIAFGFAAA
jgi:hypothetical protein